MIAGTYSSHPFPCSCGQWSSMFSRKCYTVGWLLVTVLHITDNCTIKEIDTGEKMDVARTLMTTIGNHTTVVIKAPLTCSSLGDEELATQLILEPLLRVLSCYIIIDLPLAKKMQENYCHYTPYICECKELWVEKLLQHISPVFSFQHYKNV